MDTLDFDHILHAMAESAHGLLDDAQPVRLGCYTTLELLTRKLEDRSDELHSAASSQHFWRIRAHADAAMGFSLGNGASAEAHLERILEAIDELRSALLGSAPMVIASQEPLPRLCLAS